MALISQIVALIGDLASVALAFWIAYLLRYHVELGGDLPPGAFEPFGTFTQPLLVCLGLTLILLPMRGLYRLPGGRLRSVVDEIPLLFGGFTTVMAGVVMIAFYLRFTQSRLLFIYVWVLGIVLMIGHRLIGRLVRRWLWRRDIGVDRVLVVGDVARSRRLMQALLAMPHLGYRLVGHASDPALGEELRIAGESGMRVSRRLGAPGEVGAIVTRHGVDEVIIVPGDADRDLVVDVMRQCRESVVAFRLVPDVLEFSLDRVAIDEVGGLPLIGVRDASIRGWNAFFKRAFDIVVASGVLIVAAIPMAIIAVLIRRDSEGGVFFRQTRVGKDGDEFTMLKFRCMVDGADRMAADLAAETGQDPRLFKMKDDPRLTRIGKHLRRFSLDELPQFIQVLTGEMSLVGPRPPLPTEVALYEPWHRQRLAVKPGLTGLWQVNGRSDLSFDEMVRLDLYYAENWSLWLDLKIALRTIPAVLMARGAY